METVLYVLVIVYYTMALCSLVSEKLEKRREKNRDQA